MTNERDINSHSEGINTLDLQVVDSLRFSTTTFPVVAKPVCTTVDGYRFGI